MIYYISNYSTNGEVIKGGFTSNAVRLKQFIRYFSYGSDQTIDINFPLRGGIEYEIYRNGSVLFV